MNPRPKGSPPPPAAFTVRDVYYVVFRHKWMIAILALLGVVGYFAAKSLIPFPFTSEAEIMIKYVQDNTAPSNIDAHYLNDYTSSILTTEVRIMTSRDLALQVATNIGPEKYLGRHIDSNEMAAAQLMAAGLITANFKADVPRDSEVIPLHFSGTDPIVVQQVLFGIISAYKSKYYEIHLAQGISEGYLNEKTDEAHAKLVEAMRTLKEEKSKHGITDLTEAQKSSEILISRLMGDTLQVKAELAEAASTVMDLQERVSNSVAAMKAANHSTNMTPAAVSPGAPLPPSPVIAARYRNLNSILDNLRTKEDGLLMQFQTNSPKVQAVQKQRETAEANLKQFETENPGVIALRSTDTGRIGAGPSAAPVADPAVLLRDAVAMQHRLEARYKELTNQLAVLREQATVLDNGADEINRAESEKAVAEKTYTNFQSSAEQTGINAAIGSKVSNFSVIEQPTLGLRDKSKIQKAATEVLALFLALAFGLPFLIEMVLDQSLKHPADVQARIALPYFITLPRTNGHGKLALNRAKAIALLPANTGQPPAPGAEENTVPLPADGAITSWDARHELRPFFETLRDRLMTYFEMINLTHKPKLVAVTSCGPGAGVTTTAAGLASSLSETGDGNVLLVSMNEGDGEAQHFYKGKLACGIEDALGKEKRNSALVQENLYIAKEAEAEDGLPRVLPRRFSHLVPMMKASDFDYIIFDMPPVSEISITPRLARFMDMVLLVIESEKTSRDAAIRVASLLSDTKTNVGLVLNKNRSYLPKRLEQTM